MCLATATADGIPSARMVLMKGYDERGISFYTHFASRKGIELESGLKRAALVFHWPHLVRSVRVEGQRLPRPRRRGGRLLRLEASRVAGRGARLGAIKGLRRRRRAELRPRAAEAAAAKFADESRGRAETSLWGGFRVAPDRVEFWTGRSCRLHDRVLYTKEEGGGGEWKVERLAP